MSADRLDVLWARGHVHIEKVIMTNVWVRDGDWNSIRCVSQRVCHHRDWMIEHLLF